MIFERLKRGFFLTLFFIVEYLTCYLFFLRLKNTLMIQLKREKLSIWMQILVNSSSNRAVTLYLSTIGFYIISSVMHAF